MAKITAEDVSKALCRLALHYRDPDVNPETLEVLVEDYLEDLGGMEQETFRLAVPEARRACRFFPKSCDILEASKRIVPMYQEFPALPESRLPVAEQIALNKKWAGLIKGCVEKLRSPCARPQ
ncbi:hypothetical protein [Solidesulfovibrio sp.]